VNVHQWIQFLAWSALFNYGVLMLTFILFLAMRDWIHRVHGRWFALTPTQIDLALYTFLGCYKLAIWFFLLVPALVLWWLY
jgi:hypothetical protein